MAITPVSATIPTVVFTPATSGTPHAFLYNSGPAPVWLGGSAVSTSMGVALAANDKLDLSYNAGTIYAISGYQTTSPQGTVITAATALGGTTLTNAAGTSFTAGMWIAIEGGTPRQEIAQVNGSNAGSVFTNGPLAYVHGTTVTFSQITPAPTTVKNSHIGAT